MRIPTDRRPLTRGLVRTIILCTVALLQSCAAPPRAHAPLEDCPGLRVVTWNIRFDNPADGPHAWPLRRDRVAGMLRSFDADIISLQEVLAWQLEFLRRELRQYEFVGVGRNDGHAAGEFAPVAFHRDRFRAQASGTWWMSPTPDQPGIGWDASTHRIATWVRLLDLDTNQELLVLSVHLDHRGESSRRESALLLDRLLREETSVILMGDFNAAPNSQPHGTLTTNLIDAAGPDRRATWCGWDGAPDPGRRIDWILLRGFRSIAYHVPQWSDRTKPESDHLPVIVCVDSLSA